MRKELRLRSMAIRNFLSRVSTIANGQNNKRRTETGSESLSPVFFFLEKRWRDFARTKNLLVSSSLATTAAFFPFLMPFGVRERVPTVVDPTSFQKGERERPTAAKAGRADWKKVAFGPSLRRLLRKLGASARSGCGRRVWQM